MPSEGGGAARGRGRAGGETPTPQAAPGMFSRPTRSRQPRTRLRHRAPHPPPPAVPAAPASGLLRMTFPRAVGWPVPLGAQGDCCTSGLVSGFCLSKRSGLRLAWVGRRGAGSTSGVLGARAGVRCAEAVTGTGRGPGQLAGRLQREDACRAVTGISLAALSSARLRGPCPCPSPGPPCELESWFLHP